MSNDMRKLMEAVNGMSDQDMLREYREDDQEEIADELEEMKAHLENIMHEIGNLIDQTDERQAARSYWYGHIMGALDNDSEYMSGSMTTMQDSIDAIRESGSEEEDDDGTYVGDYGDDTPDMSDAELND